MPKKIESITDLTPDPENANTGTARGSSAVETSLREYGAGRSILADRDGVILAGNKTHEQAVDLGLKVRVVETDGHELVVVQRKDLSLADEPARARGIAYADNRAGELGLAWDPARIQKDLDEGLQMPPVFFTEEEIEERLGTIGEGGNGDTPSTSTPASDEETNKITVQVDAQQKKTIKAAIALARRQPHATKASTEKRTNGHALADICAVYMEAMNLKKPS